MSKKTFSCQDCDKYESCKSLCAAAESFVNQDSVDKKKKEKLSGIRNYYKNKNSVYDTTKSTEENIIALFFVERMKEREIAEILYVSQQYVSKIIIKYRPIIVKNIKK